ncbi:MAG: peptidylprolyl isomerase [Hahellaceae bacterium]|nr:peptidylprolyl isomerase [Hahellaceae bacterium]MCP5211915.1 peptidylprolyl isomerase [Hahellaceae bacterium]
MKNLGNKLLVSFFTLLLSFCVTANEPDNSPRVKIETTEGVVILELNPSKAPISVENFLTYVNDGYYNGTIFHRVIPNFMVQGGGFDDRLNQKPGTRKAIRNEADNKLHNSRGTVAMARTNAPHSATSQFYINVVDNNFLDQNSQSYGYAVFGKVVEGMDVVDKISQTQTGQKSGMGDVPIKNISIIKATIIKDEASAK